MHESATSLATIALRAGAAIRGVVWPLGARAHEARLVADAQGTLD
jgi:hypothetical protein